MKGASPKKEAKKPKGFHAKPKKDKSDSIDRTILEATVNRKKPKETVEESA